MCWGFYIAITIDKDEENATILEAFHVGALVDLASRYKFDLKDAFTMYKKKDGEEERLEDIMDSCLCPVDIDVAGDLIGFVVLKELGWPASKKDEVKEKSLKAIHDYSEITFKDDDGKKEVTVSW